MFAATFIDAMQKVAGLPRALENWKPGPDSNIGEQGYNFVKNRRFAAKDGKARAHQIALMRRISDSAKAPGVQSTAEQAAAHLRNGGGRAIAGQAREDARLAVPGYRYLSGDSLSHRFNELTTRQFNAESLRAVRRGDALVPPSKDIIPLQGWREYAVQADRYRSEGKRRARMTELDQRLQKIRNPGSPTPNAPKLPEMSSPVERLAKNEKLNDATQRINSLIDEHKRAGRRDGLRALGAGALAAAAGYGLYRHFKNKREKDKEKA